MDSSSSESTLGLAFVPPSFIEHKNRMADIALTKTLVALEKERKWLERNIEQDMKLHVRRYRRFIRDDSGTKVKK